MGLPSSHPNRQHLIIALKAQNYVQAEALLDQGVPLAERPNLDPPDILFWRHALRHAGTFHMDWLWQHGLRPSRPALAFEALKEALLAHRLDVADWWVSHGAPLVYPGPFDRRVNDHHRRPELVDVMAEKGAAAAIGWLAVHHAPMFSQGPSDSPPIWTAIYQQSSSRVLSVVQALIAASPDTLMEPNRYGARSGPHNVLLEVVKNSQRAYDPATVVGLWDCLAQACQKYNLTIENEVRKDFMKTRFGPELQALEHARERQAALTQVSAPHSNRRCRS